MRILLLSILIFSTSAYANSWMDEYSKEKLLKMSWDSPSQNRKVIIRSYLVQKYPNSPEGIFSKNYIDWYNKNNKPSNGLYYICESNYCKYNNISEGLNKDNVIERFKEYKELLVNNYEFNNYSFIRSIYFNILDEVQNKEDRKRLKEEFLQDWQTKLGDNIYIFDFIRGLEQEYTYNNYEKAREYYKAALFKKGGNLKFELMERYINVVNTKLFNPSIMKIDDKLKTIEFMVNFYITNVSNNPECSEYKDIYGYRVFKQIADFLPDNHTRSLAFYKAAFDIYPTSEIVDIICFKIQNRDGYDEAINFLQSVLSREILKDNYYIDSLLAFYYVKKNKFKEANFYYQKALENAQTVRDKWYVVNNYGSYLENYLSEFDLALEMYKSFLNYSSFEESVNTKIYKNRVSAKDIEGADKFYNNHVKSLDYELTRNGIKEIEDIINKSSTGSKNPEIIATTIFSGSNFTLSPNEKYFIAGKFQAEFWDFEKMVKLKNIRTPYCSTPKRKFSPDGKYVAMLGDYRGVKHSIIIFDINTQSIISNTVLPFEDMRYIYFSWSPFSDEIIIISDKAVLIKYSLIKKKIIQVIDKDSVYYGDIKWSIDGKYIFVMERVSLNGNGKIIVYDAKSLKYVKKLNQVNWPHALGTTKNGKYLICVDNRRVLHRWDIKKGFEHKSMRVPVVSDRIVSHPTRSEIILNDWGGGDNNKIVIINLLDMKENTIRNVGKSLQAHYEYINNGNNVAHVRLTKENDSIIIYDSTNLNVVTTLFGETNIAKKLFKIENLNAVLTTDGEGVHIWDITLGKKIHSWRIKNIYKIFQMENNNEKFIALAFEKNKTSVFQFDIKLFKREKIGGIDLRVFEWGVVNGYLFISGVEFFGANKQHSDRGSLRLYNLDNFKLIKSIEINIVTKLQEYSFLCNTGFEHVSISPDHSLVGIVTRWQDGFGHSVEKSKSLRIFNFNNGKFIRKIINYGDINWIAFLNNNEIIINNDLYNIKSGEQINSSKVSFDNSILSYNNEKSGGYVNIKDLGIRLTYDNCLKFYKKNKKTEKLILTLIIKRNNQWIAYTPNGEYTSSIYGTKKMFWQLGKMLLPFSAFENKYKNTKIISKTLKGIITGKKTLGSDLKKKISPDLFKPPYELKVISEKSFKTTDKKYDLQISIKKKNANLKTPDLKIQINGRSIDNDNVSWGYNENKTSAKYNKSINLVEGLNIIQVNYNYKNIIIAVDTIIVTKELKSDLNRKEEASHTNLWFFGVGISKYEKSEQDLKYAAVDVYSLEKILKTQKKKLFNNVYTKIIANEKATAKNIRIELRRFLKKASNNDIILIFIAGHGVQDNDQNLYFLTYDANANEPYTGLEMSNFENFLRRRPINQKAIMWIDICHSGLIGEKFRRGTGVTSEDVVKQLANGTGTIVFASSTGREYSFESEIYGGGHGAFSYSLIQGLSGKADRNNDGVISVLELHCFVSSNVPNITNGDQHPTSTNINLRDFPIARKSK